MTQRYKEKRCEAPDSKYPLPGCGGTLTGEATAGIFPIYAYCYLGESMR